MIDKYETKKNEITILLSTRFSQNEVDINRLLQDFFNRKSELISLRESFSTIPTIDDAVNDQYKTFLQAEITQFNPQSLYLLEEHTQSKIYSFLDKQDFHQLCISPNDNTVISWINAVPKGE